MKSFKKWIPFILLVIGIIFRLIYSYDIEYKADEIETFKFVEHVNNGTAPFPWIGQNSSNGLRHPGFGVWIYIWIGKLFNVATPVGVARITQWFNCFALVFFLWFCFYVVNKEDRKIWLGGFAIACVNPLSVILERKIWHPSIMPLFMMIFIYGWWYRNQKWKGSFLWGLFGVLTGQLHMSGFYFTIALVVWTFLFDIKKKMIQWKHWFLGSVLGTLPMIPWFFWVYQNHSNEPLVLKPIRIIMFKFWNYWFSNPLGWIMRYSLGQDFKLFLKHPYIFDTPTYLMALLHIILIIITAVLLISIFIQLKNNRGRWLDLFIGRESNSELLVSSALWGCGIFVTLTAINIERHFHFAIYPLSFMFISKKLLNFHPELGKKILAAFVFCQILVTAQMLSYIHNKGSPIIGDYGTPYILQNR